MYFARRCVATIGVILCASSAISSANGQEAEAQSTERRGAARSYFEQGERAYEARDYVLAAKAFDEAYRAMPHYAPLWNAARSWERAGEQTRAANAYAKYLRSAPADAPDRDAAMAALGALAERLGRIEVYAAEIDVVRIDDEVLDGTSVYVHPGMHVVEGQSKDTKIRRTDMIEAGTVRSVALVEDNKMDEIDSSISAPVVKELARPPRKSTASSPMIFAPNRGPVWFGPAAIVAGGMTIASASLVLWSGMDTLSARKEFDAAPTADKLAAGKDKQLRTNLLLGATIASGMATGVFLSLWKWNGSTKSSALTVLPPVMGLPTQIVFAGSF
jgi:tetratricopeptide (TPR) repeat protein